MAALAVPNEIIEIILLSLPVKSLLRFKSVSKSWNTTISDPRFIRTHYHLSMAKSDNSLFLKDDEDGWFSFVRLEGRQLKTEARVWRPPLGWRGETWRWQYKTFLCIADGFLLLSSDPNTFLLWNPLTKQETIIQFPYYNSHIDPFFNLNWVFWDSDASFYMYGVCSINEDVKVVFGFKYYYTVYSCNNHSWAGRKAFRSRIDADRSDGGLSVNGAIYWICLKKHRIKLLLCFDSKDDSFRTLQLPENLKYYQRFDLKAMKGRLYLCCYGENGRTVKIWIREKGGCSWKVLVNINNLDNATINRLIVGGCSWKLYERIRVSVVAPLTENEIVMRIGMSIYCIYNCYDNSYQEIEVNGTLWKRLHPFLGSMFFPEGTKANSD